MVSYILYTHIYINLKYAFKITWYDIDFIEVLSIMNVNYSASIFTTLLITVCKQKQKFKYYVVYINYIILYII